MPSLRETCVPKMPFRIGARAELSGRWQVLHDFATNSSSPDATAVADGPVFSPGEPGLVGARLHHDDVADHLRVLDAAVLAAEEVERARPVRLEPVRRVARGEDVHVDAERGHEEVVDDVLGDHPELDGPSRPGRGAR